MSPETRTVATSSSLSRPASQTSTTRFLPGDVLVGRYRIIALLGRGGMGEVYRADDLTLDQPVALKFLARAATSDEAAVARFRTEVRIARGVSHPNVCRVYDLAEVDGEYFLSMEYVDGEDLGSLLRRIGRLPEDKGLDIARRLCAGLAAAHERGVLHRDLKPGNVMLDGRGQVLLTDFGLAGIAGEIAGNEVRNGTPAYMAPEQLSGKEVSVRSDIYSLGLVLHEIFTGRKPEDTKTPTNFVRDLDPTIDRVIMRCIERDPINRPKTVLAVSAALPGGDPLAAALAAGETPSPQMVAAAGEGVGMSIVRGSAWLTAILAGLMALAIFTHQYSFLTKIDPPFSPEILSQKAREIIADLGYPGKPIDQAMGFSWNEDLIQYATDHDNPKPDWDKVSKDPVPVLRFWYRQSKDPLIGQAFKDDKLTPGMVNIWDPPNIVSGMVSVLLDPHGRLLEFEAVPDQKATAPANLPVVDWSNLLRAAHLDPALLHEAEPEWTFLPASDIRKAWTGKVPGSDRPVRFEASAFHGKPVAFREIGPWTKAERMPTSSSSWNFSGGIAFIILLTAMAFLSALLLARMNLKRGSGDRKGAFRIALFVFAVQMALWLCRAHFTSSEGTAGMAFLAVCTSVFYGVFIWAIYLAFEPQVRRRWPQALIGSTSVLSGQWRDPVVGHDLLYGIGLALVWQFAGTAFQFAFGTKTPSPDLASTSLLGDSRQALGAWLLHVPGAIRSTLLLVLLLLLFRTLFKRELIASAVFVLSFAGLQTISTRNPIADGATNLVIYAIIAWVGFRVGILSLAVALLIVGVMNAVPATFSPSDWFFWNAMFMYGSVALISIAAFRVATSDQPIWRKAWFD